MGNVRTYVKESAEATLYLEVYDSVSGEILARIVDAQTVGNHSFAKLANRVTNRADAKRTMKKWAKTLRTKFEQAKVK